MNRKTNAALKKEAWNAFSRYVRTRDHGRCFTCDVWTWDPELGQVSIKVMQAGHFRHGVLDFDEENVHCQCDRCNRCLGGNLKVYAQRLVDLMGAEKFVDLNNRADTALRGEKRTDEEYIEIREIYVHKLSTVSSL